jgi:hypothetical protein
MKSRETGLVGKAPERAVRASHIDFVVGKFLPQTIGN